MRPKAPIRAINETGDTTIDVQLIQVPDSAITAGSNTISIASSTGDVTGPASATDNAIVRFDGTTGKLVQNSAVTVADTTGSITTGATGFVVSGNVSGGFATTATAGATTTLTVASKQVQEFTGTTTQTVVLPVVSTLPQVGYWFRIMNNSTGVVTVQSSGANTIQALAAGTSCIFTANALSGTGASVWTAGYYPRYTTDNNLTTNNIASGFATTATAAGTTTLTVADKRTQEFTGTSTQTVVLPVVSTLLQIGFSFTIINNSTGAVTVQSSGANTIATLPPSSSGTFVANALSGTGASVWNYNLAGGSSNVGYLESPINSQSSDYTCVLLDSGKTILETGASKTITIPANGSVAYPVGTCLSFICTNASGCSIAITTDTMTLANSTTTGTRTLAQNGRATAQKMTSTTWLISGVGLTALLVTLGLGVLPLLERLTYA